MDRAVGAEVHIYAHAAQAYRGAAAQLVQQVAEAVARRGRCALALAGGSTPRALYALLAEAYAAHVPWSDLHLFWGDERYVPPTSPQSNGQMAHDALISRVPIPPTHIYRVDVSDADPDVAARAYAARLKAYFEPQAAFPRFDVVLLGIGGDGHTASLFPGTPALGEQKRWVVPARAPDPPHQRLTLTFPVLNAARAVHVLAVGAAKAEAVQCALRQPPDAERCPAGCVRPAQGRLVWWLDRAAARLL